MLYRGRIIDLVKIFGHLPVKRSTYKLRPSVVCVSEIEKSHGDAERVVSVLARLVLRGGAGRAPPLAPLLQCLHVPAPPAHVLRAAAQALADQRYAHYIHDKRRRFAKLSSLSN